MSYLHAQIERITYANEETGYAVAKVYAKGHEGLVAVVGILPSPNPGEILKMQGVWESHPKYGQQFKVQTCETILPATANAIQKYLGSGLIKGIGPVMAGRIVKLFGEQALDHEA